MSGLTETEKLEKQKEKLHFTINSKAVFHSDFKRYIKITVKTISFHSSILFSSAKTTVKNWRFV
jgi:hypothetical protein